MKPSQPGRRPSQIAAALGALLVTASCANVAPRGMLDSASLSGDFDGSTGQLLSYCTRLRQGGNLTLAAAMCERAHQIDPTKPEPLMELAAILTEMDRPEASVEAYRRILEADPNHVEARYALGKTYIAMGQHDLALREFRAALEIAPTDPRLYNALGIANGLLGAHASAQEAFRAGLKITPDDVSLRNNLGLSLVLGGHPEEGLAILGKLAASPAANDTTRRNLELAQGIASTAAAEAAIDGAPAGGDVEAEAKVALLPLPEDEVVALGADADARGGAAAAAIETAPLSPVRYPRASPVALARAFGWPDDDAAGLGRGVIHSPDPVTHGTPPRPALAAAQTGEPRPPRRAIPIIVQTARAAAAEASDADAPSGYMGDYLTADAEAAAPTPRPAAPAEAQRGAGAGGGYAIQFASYRSEERARSGWQAIRATAGAALEGVEPVVRRADLGTEKGIFYRLRSRPTSQAAAEALCGALAASGIDCLVVEETSEAAAATAAAR